MDVQSLHQLEAMVFNGLRTDSHQGCGLFGILAGGKVLENLTLALRQSFQRLTGIPSNRGQDAGRNCINFLMS